MAAHAYSQQSDFAGDTPLDGVIPRISVEAFCETDAFATAVEEAASDRRMIKASVAVQSGGMEAALDRYHDVQTPNLLIVETDEDGVDIFQRLEDLAEVCDPSTKVLVAGESNDVTLYRELIRQGVQDYIVTPAAPMQIIDAIGNIYAEENTAPRARAIGFMGARGGSGASTLAHNVAFHIAKAGNREVMLVDMDVEFGAAALNFNIEPTRTILDALRSVGELDDVKLRRLIVDQGERLKLLAAPSSLEMELDIDAASVQALVDVVRQSTDIAVFDIPHGWESWRRAALTQMDEIVLVATPDLNSLRNLKNMYEALRQRRPNDPAPRILLNQMGISKNRPEIPVKEFVEIVGAKPDAVLGYDGRLFGAASNGGQMLVEVSPSARQVVDLEAFARKVATKTPLARPASGGGGGGRAKRKKKGMFSFLK